MAGPTDLYDLAAGLLADVVAIFAAPIGGGPPIALPDRQYVSDGQAVAFDCAELVVAAPRLYTGYAASENLERVQRGQGVPVAAEFTIYLTRCVPKIDTTGSGQVIVPTPTEIDASAQAILQDGWVLYAGVLQRHHAGTLFADCEDVFVGQLLSLGPEGGLGGWALPVRTQIGS